MASFPAPRSREDYLSDLCFVIFSLLKAFNVRKNLVVTTLCNKVGEHTQLHAIISHDRNQGLRGQKPGSKAQERQLQNEGA